jgi:hypothetical protein
LEVKALRSQFHLMMLKTCNIQVNFTTCRLDEEV